MISDKWSTLEIEKKNHRVEIARSGLCHVTAKSKYKDYNVGDGTKNGAFINRTSALRVVYSH